MMIKKSVDSILNLFLSLHYKSLFFRNEVYVKVNGISFQILQLLSIAITQK